MVELGGEDNGGWRQRIDSPRIESLRRELEMWPSATDDFWLEIATSAAPLVEEIPGDDDARCVTFLYRDFSGDLEHVLLCGDIVYNDYANYLLQRVGSSDLFTLSLRLPADTSTLYQLAPNDSLEPAFPPDSSPSALLDHLTWNQPDRRNHWRPDPLNPRRFVPPDNAWVPAMSGISSILELPNAAPRKWSLPAAPAERMPQLHQVIDDSPRGGPRRVWYQKVGDGAPQRLLIGTDGWEWIHFANMPLTLARLHEAGLLPPLAAIYVDCGTPRMRLRDYGGSHEHSDYLAHEIVPAAERHFGIAATADRTIIYGKSGGGITALTAGFRHPDVFGHVLSVAAPAMLTTTDIPKGVAGEAQSMPANTRPRVYLQAGRLEIDQIWGGHLLDSNQDLYRELVQLGFDVAFDVESCGHDTWHYRESIVKGLVKLVGA